MFKIRRPDHDAMLLEATCRMIAHCGLFVFFFSSFGLQYPLRRYGLGFLGGHSVLVAYVCMYIMGRQMEVS